MNANRIAGRITLLVGDHFQLIGPIGQRWRHEPSGAEAHAGCRAGLGIMDFQTVTSPIDGLSKGQRLGRRYIDTATGKRLVDDLNLVVPNPTALEPLVDPVLFIEAVFEGRAGALGVGIQHNDVELGLAPFAKRVHIKARTNADGVGAVAQGQRQTSSGGPPAQFKDARAHHRLQRQGRIPGPIDTDGCRNFPGGVGSHKRQLLARRLECFVGQSEGVARPIRIGLFVLQDDDFALRRQVGCGRAVQIIGRDI